ncbi:hypothetical protein E7T09_04575 [Deinococcus sp. KSM4-11]|uniref:hypothetical protein n=1 Tax=Deinococcus sp. KSM4-11 TaxID=2568654 RepID=UPI0010A2E15C|nr:hypothetical protein [Deinococcus sp. KSM4-11]THF88486.1 hypothetical protein E7T09_04575 [Deinococcus sp. KSM4-11]
MALWLGALLIGALLGVAMSALARLLVQAALVMQISLAGAATVELIREASRHALERPPIPSGEPE